MKMEESHRVLYMEDEIHKDYVNQEEAIQSLSRAIRRAYAGIKDPKRPHRKLSFPRSNWCWKDVLGEDLGPIFVW